MSNQSRVSGEVVVAVSLGGTKLAVALVYSNGLADPNEADWRTVFEIAYGPEDQGNEEVRAEAEKKLIRGMADWMKQAFDRAKQAGLHVKKYGISTKGPLRKERDSKGEFVIVGPCTTLPFKECALDRVLKCALEASGITNAEVKVIHDGAAAALGEVNRMAANSGGSMTRATKNMAAVIIGTGIGVGVIEDGEVYNGVDPNQDGADYERNLGSLGRHLVCIKHQQVSPGQWSGDCCYQYRGAPLGEKYPPICKRSGEVYFTERVAGPWLAKEIARLLKQQSQGETGQASRTLTAMQVTIDNLDQLLNLDREDKKSKALQERILVGLTLAAQQEDDWVRCQIGAIGTEIGAALAQFILAFRKREFVKKIVLVSTVSEKLGDGVALDRSSPFERNKNDLLMDRIRTATEVALSSNGVDQDEAAKLASGIERSLLGGERELWAFSPGIVSNNSGVACDCANCGTPQWYDRGICQGCGSASDITHTWIAQCATGGVPKVAPKAVLQLAAAAGDQLINVWADLVLLRGLSPYLVPPPHNLVQYSSPAWYVERGIKATVQYLVPADPGFSERLNRASSWANQSLLVRLVATFEAFLDTGKHLRDFQLPNTPGMREFHHARRLRNAVAHGDALTDGRLVDEARDLFGPSAVVEDACNLDIRLVLEPLWARLLVYARSLEVPAAIPECPAVVVAARDHVLVLQSFAGESRVLRDGTDRRVGDLVSLRDTQ